MIESLDCPAIPPLVFTVAVTGHQDIPAAHHAALQTQIAALLEQLRAQLTAQMAMNAIDRERALTCRFVSALAPGADQIGARAALAAAGIGTATEGELQWRLQAILPFAQPICARLAGTALEQRGVSEPEIVKARAAFAELAGKAERVLELADWQPGDDTQLAQNWQARRYATIGQLLVRQADLLIALWDGKPPRGRGGTADVVSEARRSGVPVIWIDPAAPEMARSMPPDPGSRHLPASDMIARHRSNDARVRALIPDGPDAAMSAAIGQVLLGNDPARAICVRQYRDEPAPELWIAEDGDSASQPGDRHGAYALMLYLFLNWPTRLRRHVSADDKAQGHSPGALRSYPFRKARRDGTGLARQVLLYPFGFGVDRTTPGTAHAAPLLDYAARADALATRLSNQYRSAYVLIFMLAAVAVMWAVISALMLKLAPDYKHWLVVLELITVSAAAAIYLRTRANDPVSHHPARRSWLRRIFPRSQDTHQRWLDARLIAESQRSGQLLAWVGFSGRRPINPAVAAGAEHDDHAGSPHGHAAPRTVWAPHFANAIAALPRLPGDDAPGRQGGVIGPAQVAALAGAAAKVIDDQLAYHDLNHQRLEALNHRLDTFSLRAIQVAAAISLIYLAAWALKQPVPAGAAWGAVPSLSAVVKPTYEFLKYAAAFGGAVLPAVAAAAAGIRFQGDFERFAMRSRDTAERLKALIGRAERIRVRAEDCGAAACRGEPPLFEPLLDVLLDVQAVLDEDLADWRFAYAARPITLG